MISSRMIFVVMTLRSWAGELGGRWKFCPLQNSQNLVNPAIIVKKYDNCQYWIFEMFSIIMFHCENNFSQLMKVQTFQHLFFATDADKKHTYAHRGTMEIWQGYSSSLVSVCNCLCGSDCVCMGVWTVLCCTVCYSYGCKWGWGCFTFCHVSALH